MILAKVLGLHQMEFLSNPWVIGIGGGILSGFVVNFATRFFLGRRENREYHQKVRRANQEIVYAIRPGISEGCLPTFAVVESLTNSTARRMGVESSDLYKPHEIAEELTKEVMDSSFLAASKKQEYCEQLTTLAIRPRTTFEESEERVLEYIASREDYRVRSVSLASALPGTMTAVISLVWVVGSESLNTEFVSDFGKISLTMVAAVASVALAVGIRSVRRRLYRERDVGSGGATGTICPECNKPMAPYEPSCGSCGFSWSKKSKGS